MGSHLYAFDPNFGEFKVKGGEIQGILSRPFLARSQLSEQEGRAEPPYDPQRDAARRDGHLTRALGLGRRGGSALTAPRGARMIAAMTDIPSAASKDGGVDPKLLEILVCPLTKGPLSYDRAAQELISEQARLAYPIRDGIPIMLVDEARSLDDAPGKR